MESETYLYSEWRIENFSFWRLETHRRRIVSETKSYGRYELYPKGPNGLDECMVVHVSKAMDLDSLMELHFIGPNGSLISKQPVNPIKGKNLQIPNGPRFGEVISVIRKYKAEHGDRLIIQFRSNKRELKLYMFTEIEVIDASFKMDIEKELKSSSADIRYSCDDMLYLSATGGQNLTFSLGIGRSDGRVSVLTRITLISSDGSLTRYKENEHSFGARWENWNLPDLLTDNELKEKAAVSLLLRMKIITGDTRGHDREVLSYEGISKVPNDTVCSEIKSSKSLDTVSFKPAKTPADMLSKDLMFLYQDQDFSDFQLKCGDVSFPVHKNILSARSPVFKTMLSTDMKEAASGCMDIVDMDAPTLGIFLTYVYTGALEELQGKSALKLYYAADKYQVPSLKRECADFLSVNLSIENLIDIMTIADKHQDDELTTLSHNFISNNYAEVLRSEEWKRFMNAEPFIVAKTLTQLAERNRASC